MTKKQPSEARRSYISSLPQCADAALSIHRQDVPRSGSQMHRAQWGAVEVPATEPLRHATLEALFDRSIAGVYLPDVLAPEQCRRAQSAVRALSPVGYGGAAGNLGAGIGIPHWSPRYPGDNTAAQWQHYFDHVPEWDAQRRETLTPIFGVDPLDIAVRVIEANYNGKVERAYHPRFGRLMGAGLVRSGSAQPHIDDAGFDLGFECTGHVGLVLVLDGRSDGRQRAYRASLQTPQPENGNYGLTPPRDADWVDVPSVPGSLSLLAAQYIHEVFDCEQRLTLSLHIARRKDGSLIYYS